MVISQDIIDSIYSSIENGNFKEASNKLIRNNIEPWRFARELDEQDNELKSLDYEDIAIITELYYKGEQNDN